MGGEQGHNKTCTASEEERLRLETKCSALRSKLQATQKRRRDVKQLIEKGMGIQTSKWLERRNEAAYQRACAADHYNSTVSRRLVASASLDMARKWNVTNDCFYIWHCGPFGTINGLRLGSEIQGSSVHDDSAGKTVDAAEAYDTAVKSRDTNRYSHLFSGSLWGDSSTTNRSSNGIGSTDKDGTPISADTGVKVPWVEINSALGMVALLLSTLEKKPRSGIHFKNEIVPMGSCSKIGLRRGDTLTMYNLYSDDSFQFFGKRNFNSALQILLQCLADASVAVEKRDRTIALPHPIDMTARGGPTIGGLTISYGNDERWTRAMKFVLTDIKWLVGFTTKHVDR